MTVLVFSKQLPIRIIKLIGRMNEHKRKLLRQQNAYPQINEEWIMLEEINPSNRTPNNTHGFTNTNAAKYHKLQDNPLPQPIYHAHKIEQIPRQTPFNPKIITMNGQTFKEVEKNKPQPQSKPKKSKIPPMHVSCYYCTCMQSVPGTSEQFKCCSCMKLNQCMPTLKIFICGTCSTKVCYAVSTSNMIRCTKCGTINKVPQKTYKNQAYIKVPSSFEREQINTELEEYASIQQCERSEFGEQFELHSMKGKF